MRASTLSVAFFSLLFFLIAWPAYAEPAGTHTMTPDMGGPDMGGMAMKMTLPPMPAVYMGQASRPGAPMFKTLGDHHHAITTKNPQTQMLFDQGVRLLFGFNHAEAIRSFREAARQDPDCAMCWWGVAFALGPNINLPMQPDAIAPAWDALQKARALAPKASANERAWIAALSARYSPDPKADRAKLDEAFAAAMGKLARDYPDDLDAAVFYAEAMMDTQPWDYYEADGITPKKHGGEIVTTLEAVIARAPLHPGALHLYIHAVEASTTPERAELAADRLLTLMPGAGHIVHMPSHIYYRIGRYADAVRVNEQAATIDEQYIAACKAQGFYPLGYYGHNIHFLWTSSEMEGRYGMASDAARRLVRAIGNDATQFSAAQLYVFTPVMTDLRFGKWDAVLAAPMPDSRLALDVAMAHYARGFAYANKKQWKNAARERTALIAAQKNPAIAKIDAGGIPATQMTDVALYSLDGEIARNRGRLGAAVEAFRKAQAAEHALPYTEPPYWHQPVSHLLGAALLEARQYKEAETVYRDSLKHYRRDGWALYGLALALKGQDKANDAETVLQEFRMAWPQADVKLASSRF